MELPLFRDTLKNKESRAILDVIKAAAERVIPPPPIQIYDDSATGPERLGNYNPAERVIKLHRTNILRNAEALVKDEPEGKISKYAVAVSGFILAHEYSHAAYYSKVPYKQ